MEQWEKKFAQFCLQKKYITIEELQHLIYLENESLKKGKQENFLFLLESQLHWTNEHIQKVYQEGLQQDKTMMGESITKVPSITQMAVVNQDKTIPTKASAANQDKTMSTKASINQDRTMPVGQDKTPYCANIIPVTKEVQEAKIGRYRIIKTLGEGGMGIVYLVYDSLLQREVALKVLIPSVAMMENANERFIREAQATAKLNHPNIIRIYDVGNEQDKSFFTMEFISGKSLKEIMEEKKIEKNILLKIFQKVVNALSYAHAQGIIHRDLKPGNILVDHENEPHVMDFGLAKIMGSAEGDILTAPGAVIGSPAYMSPEQAKSELDKISKPSDVYALGVILYEMLTGQRLVQGNKLFEMFFQIIKKDTPPLRGIAPEIPEELERICLKALQKEIHSRYPSAKEMAQDLDQFCQLRETQSKKENNQSNKISKIGLLRFQYYAEESPKDNWISFFEIPINQELISIGRNRGNDICIRVPENQTRSLHISGQHCKLMVTKDKKIQIIDLKSTNGTFLNGQPLEPNKAYTMTPDSVVDLGKKEVRFIVDTGEEKFVKTILQTEPSPQKISIITTIDGSSTIQQ
ncbi:MAG: protein kinase [Candidatus Brocadiae bacterium]|nr:protein kinase [Candidatus Brocadiia bacterium]